MLNFKLEDWSILKNIFININEIIDEIVIQCDENGLKFNALDRSHICFFECNMSKDLFDEYGIDDVLYLSIDLNELVKVLKRGKGKDNLYLKANNEVIDITFKNKNNRTFSITQIDIDDNSRDMPNMEFSVEFECEFETIKNTLQDAELYSDRLKFHCSNDKLILTCDGSFGKYKNECLLNESVDGDYASAYGINYLFKIFNTKINSNNLKIHMGDEYPMLVEMSSDYVKMNYLLAPRIEQEN